MHNEFVPEQRQAMSQRVRMRSRPPCAASELCVSVKGAAENGSLSPVVCCCVSLVGPIDDDPRNAASCLSSPCLDVTMYIASTRWCEKNVAVGHASLKAATVCRRAGHE